MWLQQVHGTTVWAGDQPGAIPPVADASVATAPGSVCAILTADCLPVLFCDADGTRVGAAHAGWRGLVGGVLGTTIEALQVPASRLMAWLGPAIEPAAFEVGGEVLEQFVARDPSHAGAFERNERGRWQADLYALARGELRRLGIERVHGGGFGTFGDSRFYSYRRDKRTGRMATLIWLASGPA
jgi:YfiH family protein